MLKFRWWLWEACGTWKDGHVHLCGLPNLLCVRIRFGVPVAFTRRDNR